MVKELPIWRTFSESFFRLTFGNSPISIEDTLCALAVIVNAKMTNNLRILSFTIWNNKRAQTFRLSSSYLLGYDHETFTYRQVYTVKSTSYTGHGTFRIPCSRMFENWSYSRDREQELKALCYILFRENR